jgi:ABC-type bacteriocin/lantibiotic exporter with double-glycine peptidase domain
MSKPFARVVFAVLISFVIIAAAASPIVQSSLGSVFQKAGVNTSANTSMFSDNQTLEQGTRNEQIPAPLPYNDLAPDSSHDCGSDSSLDY